MLKGWIISKDGYQTFSQSSLKTFLSTIKEQYQECEDFEQFVFYTNFLLLDQYRYSPSLLLSLDQASVEERVSELREARNIFFNDLEIQLASIRKIKTVTTKFISFIRILVNFILDYRHPFFRQHILPAFSIEDQDNLTDIYHYLKTFFVFDGYVNKHAIQGNKANPLLPYYTLMTQIIKLFYVEIISKI